jgi:hypothetical protein
VVLKRAHPHWGPANVKLALRKQAGFATAALPSDTRLWALFKSACPEAIQPRRHQLYPARPPSPVTPPHQRWQMDGKEKVPVGEQEVATLLEIRDPVGALIASPAVLTTTAKGWRKLTLRETQDTLRAAFAEWGCPIEIQTDHENVSGGSHESAFPSHFTLWLLGLGIGPVTRRDRRPTDQPHVERNHRTLGDLGWKDEHSASVEQLQALLDDRRHRHNAELPVHAAACAGRPPLIASPGARHSGRPFAPALEWLVFDQARVEAYLANQFWQRHASSIGSVRIGGQLCHLGRRDANRTVMVRFLAETHRWRFESTDGLLLGEQAVIGLEKADLIGYVPMALALPKVFQLPLPLVGV